MDNVIENIRIEDIISSNTNLTPEESEKINDLSHLIKQTGLLDPIFVQPKDGKYEIVLGIEKYHAAKLAGLNSIPAIVKKIDDEILSKYLNIDKPNQNIKNHISENNDIINLSELNKKEYERNDLKMNNEQLNNNMINNNFNQPMPNIPNNQEPTFGAKFFPSLEDEPTNMNMTGNTSLQQPISNIPSMNNNIDNNNLIDLTDVSINKDINTPVTSNFEVPNLNNQPPVMMPQVEMGIPTPEVVNQNSFAVPTQMSAPEVPVPQMDNIINIESLQNNQVAPTIMDPNSPTVPPINLNINEPVQPQFEIPNLNNQPPVMMPQVEIGMDNSQINQPEMPSMMSEQSPVEPISMDVLNADFGVPTQMVQPEIAPPIMNNKPEIAPLKDVTPVTNTIKNLISGLESFGYKIKVNEEDLGVSVKLTIEVDK